MEQITDNLHPSLLPVNGGINFRDQGGCSVADGRKVKKGLLFRSGALSQLTPEDCQYLESIPLMHILDYRDSDEITIRPDVIWGNACYENIPANPKDESTSASLNRVEGHSLRTYYPPEYMLNLYKSLPFNNPAYHRLIAIMKHNGLNALVQHCAIGKDRTGIGSAITLFTLGANYHTVMEDYLLTETTLQPFRDNLLARLADKVDQCSMESYRYMLSAREEFLDTAISAIKDRYTNIDHWLEQEYGLDQLTKHAIREKYLED